MNTNEGIRHSILAASCALAITTATIVTAAVTPQTKPAAAPDTKCSIGAYIVDPDPQGLNVRYGPGTKFGVIASVPRGESGVSVAVTGASGKWLRIEDAEDMEDREIYKGAGWVFAAMLGTDTTAGQRELKNENAPIKIYQEPDRKSRAVGTTPAQTPVKLAGCCES